MTSPPQAGPEGTHALGDASATGTGGPRGRAVPEATVARLAEARCTVRDPKLTCAYYSYWTGVPAAVELYEEAGSWVAAAPTNDGATLVLTYFPQSRFGEVRADPLRAHLEREGELQHLLPLMPVGLDVDLQRARVGVDAKPLHEP